MKRTSLTETAHGLIRGHLRAGDLVIDATLGNGHDTLFLAQCVGDNGHVYGFDIQAAALNVTTQRLLEQGLNNRVTLFQVNHAEMRQHIPVEWQGHIQVIMFNLGYLPGADKNIMTQTDRTLQAIHAACAILMGQGMLTVMAYPGHVGGDQETRYLEQWLQTLDNNRFKVQTIFSHQHQATAPRLFVIRKLT